MNWTIGFVQKGGGRTVYQNLSIILWTLLTFRELVPSGLTPLTFLETSTDGIFTLIFSRRNYPKNHTNFTMPISNISESILYLLWSSQVMEYDHFVAKAPSLRDRRPKVVHSDGSRSPGKNGRPCEFGTLLWMFHVQNCGWFVDDLWIQPGISKSNNVIPHQSFFHIFPTWTRSIKRFQMRSITPQNYDTQAKHHRDACLLLCWATWTAVMGHGPSTQNWHWVCEK